MYRTERLELRLTPHEQHLLDTIRGPASRSAWLRNQIALAAKTVSPNEPEDE